jgi:2-(1,2-epoxy-1,2-dihydrophenyl)acetyl-CoA isomerase
MSDYEQSHAYDTVNVLRAGGAAKIELNRPERLNAWNKQFGLDLRAAIEACASDDDIRAVQITGAGRGFSSGADLKEMGDGGDQPLTDSGRPDVYTVLTERYHPIITQIRRMPKPVIAGVNGGAVGIGCSLALACDLIVAAESAYFLLAFVNIGLVPDGGSSVFLPARIGHARSFEMAMLGERVDAPTALDWGLINRVVADDDLSAAADELTARLAAGPTKSYAGTKRQLNNRIYQGLDEQLELEAQIQLEMAESDDFVQGVMAFMSKQAPDFTGK